MWEERKGFLGKKRKEKEFKVSLYIFIYILYVFFWFVSKKGNKKFALIIKTFIRS